MDNPSITDYAQLEVNKRKVQDFIMQKGIAPDDIVFMFVDSYKNTEPIYQTATMSASVLRLYPAAAVHRGSTDVEAVENISREISTLCWHKAYSSSPLQPDYYYSKLDDLKLELIEKSTVDAKARAEKIAAKSGAKLRKLKTARMGVFR